MPKRPSAIAVTPDNKSIIVGDKFGDVYRLPLLSTGTITSTENEGTPEPKLFKPAATHSTVHSARNRKALQNQLETASKGTSSHKKEPPSFEHELLLGHVSMLLDLAFVAVEDKRGSDGSIENTVRRNYIITADRDEHIRISRGPPQSHIIEGYCLGHREFVKSLCVVGSDYLLSGGGDDYLIVWRWRESKRHKIIPLRSSVEEVMNKTRDHNASLGKNESEARIAVTRIWSLRFDGHNRVGGCSSRTSFRRT